MRTARAIVLAMCVVLLQGCKVVSESPVAATLKEISNLPSLEAKYETLEALAKSPMGEDDYVALVKVIGTLNSIESRQRLLMTAINARAAAKSEAPQKAGGCK